MVKCNSCKYSSGITDGIILCEFLAKKICVTANHSCKYGKREEKDGRPD